MGKLSKRLQSILAMVPGAECAADVGTDHGYVPIWLVEQGICRRAIAMDVRKGPLQRARDHIREKGLEGYIETRLSDGLAALCPKEAQVIVIAGMGGNTMRRILEAGEEKVGEDTILILQPQSELLEFRQYLARRNYRLLAEDMVEEEGKFYPIMQVRREFADGPEQEENICSKSPGYGDFGKQRIELMYGPLLLKHKHPVLKEFLQRQQRKQAEIAAHLRSQALGAAGAERLNLLEQELAGIRCALEGYEKQ